MPSTPSMAIRPRGRERGREGGRGGWVKEKKNLGRREIWVSERRARRGGHDGEGRKEEGREGRGTHRA